MNAVELLDAISRKVQDSSYDEADLLDRLNRGLSYIALQHPLPNLQVTTSVTSVDGKTQVDMPEDYHSRLLFVRNLYTERDCTLCYTRQTLRRMYGPKVTEQGDIEAVALEGTVLHYRRLPIDPQDLDLTYYAKPEPLTASESSKPICIPEPLHYQLLVNLVLWDLYSEIEDGIEGQKVNTEYHAGQFATGMQMLQAYYPDASQPRRYFPRKAKTF